MYNQKKSDSKIQSKSDFEQKLIDIRRVARVVAGGRRFSFRATLVIGNRKGEVGVGVGKGADTALAIEKAFRKAKKNSILVALTEDYSISHKVEAKFGSAKVLIKPNVKGGGLVAGGAVRTVLDLAGVKNATAKILSSSKNKINNARATIKALRQLKVKSEK